MHVPRRVQHVWSALVRDGCKTRWTRAGHTPTHTCTDALEGKKSVFTHTGPADTCLLVEEHNWHMTGVNSVVCGQHVWLVVLPRPPLGTDQPGQAVHSTQSVNPCAVLVVTNMMSTHKHAHVPYTPLPSCTYTLSHSDIRHSTQVDVGVSVAGLVSLDPLQGPGEARAGTHNQHLSYGDKSLACMCIDMPISPSTTTKLTGRTLKSTLMCVVGVLWVCNMLGVVLDGRSEPRRHMPHTFVHKACRVFENTTQPTPT